MPSLGVRSPCPLILEKFPLLQHIIYLNKLLGITKKEMSCGKAISKIDICKDELNNPQCQYSNGHCCGEAILHFCTDCECKDPRNTQMRGNVKFMNSEKAKKIDVISIQGLLSQVGQSQDPGECAIT